MKDRIEIAIENGVADVRLIHGAKMNALDPAMFAALAEAGAKLGAEASLREIGRAHV